MIKKDVDVKMKRNLKPIFLTMALVVGVSFVAFKVDAKDRVEKTALNDYILSKNGVKANQKNNDKNNTKGDFKVKITPQGEVNLSNESLDIYAIDKIKDVKNQKLDTIIKKTDEVLWFIVKDGSVDGMVVVNKTIPIKMGGQNRSIELKAIYDKVKQEVNNVDDIKYLEVQGQGVLIDSMNNKVHLTSAAKQLLNLKEEIVSESDFLTAVAQILK